MPARTMRSGDHHHGVGADTLDGCSERDQEMREILHMRLGGDVAQIGRAVRGDRGHQCVLGRGDARLVEEDVGAPQFRGTELQPVGRLHRGPELFEGQEMRVEAPPADDVAARWRQHHLAAAGEQRPRQQDRGADARAENRIEIGGADVLGVNGEPVAPAPFGGRADRADQFHQRFGVANPRDVVERDRMLGQEGGGNDRQRRILVAGRLDGAS